MNLFKETEVTGVTETTHIHPLKLSSEYLPIIVTDGTNVIEEPKHGEDCEPYTYRFQPARLRELAELPHVWATTRPVDLFIAFYNAYRYEDDFMFHGNVSAKELRPGLGAGTVGAVVRKVGFTRSNAGGGADGEGNRSRGRRMHYLQDLRGFIDERHEPSLESQYELALEIRDFCWDMGIGTKLNFAGISSALLRHPDFYPDPRKRVPEFINEKSRLHLPGNHYDLFTETGKVVKTASYHDQRSAHHHAALLAPMPTSESLRAKGYTKDSDKGGGRIWIEPSHPAWERVLSEYGLFMVKATVPGFAEGEERYLPHDFRVPGIRSVPIWSAELPWLREMGVQIEGIEWALSGDEIDEGIRRYARWALDAAQEHPAFKSALLCTYGLLAQRRGWSRSIRGVGVKSVRWDHKTFMANVALGDTEFHSYGPTNVIQRGIIEAYTRMLTLRYVSRVPRELQLGLYGDAVLIEVDGREYVAPIDESPWRDKGTLTDLEFLSATQFRSNELTRLPGTRAGMKR